MSICSNESAVNKKQVVAVCLGLQRAKQRVKGVQTVEIKLNICENQTAFTVFGSTATGKHGMSRLLQLTAIILFSHGPSHFALISSPKWTGRLPSERGRCNLQRSRVQGSV